MERLTIREESTAAPNRETIGDICATLPILCHDFECKECPLGRLIDRLCEYEDTGLMPEEIMELTEKKNTVAKVQRCKDGREHITARVTRRGVFIRGDYYYSDKLVFEHLGDQVDIEIYKSIDIAEVIWRGKHIETFDLLDAPMIKYGATKEMIAKAIKYAKEVTSRTHQCQ